MSTNETKTYSEMVHYAKTLHPNAQVRLGDSGWEIFIETGVEETYAVDPSWAGTYAEEAFKTPDGGGDDELSRWSYKNGYRNLPLEIIAEAYNLQQESFVFVNTFVNNELAKNNILPMSKLFRSGHKITEAEWSCLAAARELAQASNLVKFKDRYAALDNFA